MNERYARYEREEFRDWKDRVNKRLPQMVITFYNAKLNGTHIPYEKEKMLGSVIEGINNPFYDIHDAYGKRYDKISLIAVRVVLELQVVELFSFINRLQKTTQSVANSKQNIH